jgi:hypothetical protein
MIKAKIIDCGADYFYLFSTADEIEDVLRKQCKPEGCNPNNHTCITENAVSFVYRGDTSK